MKRLLLLAALLTGATPAPAWWTGGHRLVGQAAVQSLPPDVPEWFRLGAGQVGHCAEDPDVVKLRETPQIRATEEPEHFLDFELLQGRELPTSRYRYLQLCQEAKLDPARVGLLPYAITEWTERLEVAFAEHRKWPGNPYIRTKCLVYAGILAHYTGDAAQPLHVTVDFDGRVGTEGASPHSGIHSRMDSILEKAKLSAADLARDQKIEPVSDLMAAVKAEIAQSRSRIDRVYRLEAQLPPARGDWSPGTEGMDLARERGREATRFTASMFLTAWRKSAEIRLPAFLERDPK